MGRIAKLVAALVIAAGHLALLPQAAQAAAIDYRLVMRGAAVVDTAGGDPDGWVNGFIDVDPVASHVCTSFGELSRLGVPTEVHLHDGAVGTNGPILATLDVPPQVGGIGTCVSVADDVIDAILADPSSFYVDLHTDEFAGGAVRAQLELMGCTLVGWTPVDEGEGGRDLYVREGERVQIRGRYWEGATVEYTLARGTDVAATGTATVTDWGHDWFFDFDYDDAGAWTFRAAVPGVAQCEDVLVITVEEAGLAPPEPPATGPLPNTAVAASARSSAWIGLGIIGAALVLGARRIPLRVASRG